ncbi:neuroglian-like isoform X2 [Adelges cooleyi]|uniref:neuroglian-like isoform X2 n=1 Tax=Adelges cooleyi TaxID=133065 RepID=UPI0021801364|nr:neuroglian-like isoform X2 [Adelges cooleyi]
MFMHKILIKMNRILQDCLCVTALLCIYLATPVLALAPVIPVPPGNVETVDGHTVTIDCKNFGAPKPHVKWTRNNIELTGGRYSTLGNGDLQITNVRFTDVGNYMCIATNNLGSVNASGSLTVKKTIELDSGIYTCLARTELDQASASAMLIVQPYAPRSLEISKKEPAVRWRQPEGESNVQIRGYSGKDVPGPVDGIGAEQWGSSAILLRWKPPKQTNGVLTGYRISYQKVIEVTVGYTEERPAISNPEQTCVKLAALKPETIYRIYIKATTNAGSGEPYFIEQRTKPALPEGILLDKPEFTYQHMATDGVFNTVRITWCPDLRGYPGSHFFVQYRFKGDTIFVETPPELDKNYIDVGGIKSMRLYEFIVVAVDGETTRQSDPLEIKVSSWDFLKIKILELFYYYLNYFLKNENTSASKCQIINCL